MCPRILAVNPNRIDSSFIISAHIIYILKETYELMVFKNLFYFITVLS